MLKDSVGQAFHGVVVAVDDNEPRPRDRVVQQPAVEAPLVGARGVPLGESVTVRLAQADPASRSVRFELA